MVKIKKVILFITSFILGLVTGSLYIKKNGKSTQVHKDEKHVMYYNLLNQWILLKNKNISIAQLLKERGINNIAIYGIGEIGKRLYEELEKSDIGVKYGIDNNPNKNNINIDVIALSDNLPEVDAIIVTAVFDYDVIYSNIRSYCDIKIISLEDIIFNNY